MDYKKVGTIRSYLGPLSEFHLGSNRNEYLPRPDKIYQDKLNKIKYLYNGLQIIYAIFHFPEIVIDR